MGFLAILAPSAPASVPLVKRCHVNIWALRSLVPGRRLFYVDVGIEVEAIEADVDTVEMLLPFRVEEGTWSDGSKVVEDLYRHLTDPETSELIFGGPVRHEQHGEEYTVKIGDYAEPMRLTRIRPSMVRRVEDYPARADSSLYSIPLASTVKKGTSAYFRVRWRVFGAAPMWRWKRFAGGARVDFRICDVRESAHADTERHLRERMVKIEQANVFLMAPSSLVLGTQSPAFKYLRTLEPGAWRDYLKGASSFGNPRETLVYYWQYLPKPAVSKHGILGAWKGVQPGKQPSPSTSPISSDNPFRVFLDFERPASRVWWLNVLQVLLAIVVAAGILRLSGSLDPADLRDFDLSDLHLTTYLQVAGALSVLAFISWIERVRGWAAHRFLTPRLLVRRLERLILRIRIG